MNPGRSCQFADLKHNMGERRSKPLSEVSNLPRTRTIASGLGGVKRSITPSIGSGSPPKRHSGHARRGTVTSTLKAPSLNNSSRRQTEYRRNVDESSTLAVNGRKRATMTFSSGNSRARPQLPTPAANSETSRTEQERDSKGLQMQIEMLHNLVSKKDTSIVKEEIDSLRIKLNVVEAQIMDAKKEAAEKTNLLNQAEIEEKTLELELEQVSTTATRQEAEFRRKILAAEEDLRKWKEKCDDIKVARMDLEKHHALVRSELEARNVDVARLDKDLILLRRRHEVLNSERERYLAQIRQLEDALSKADALKKQASSELEERSATIKQLESDIRDENLQENTCGNELLALGAQYKETSAQYKERQSVLEKLRNEGKMHSKSFDEQLRDGEEHNALMQKKLTTQLDGLKNALASAQSSLAEAKRKAEADEKSLSSHNAEVARIRQENSLVRVRVEASVREVSAKDEVLAELASDLSRLGLQSSETQQTLTKLHGELKRLKKLSNSAQ